MAYNNTYGIQLVNESVFYDMNDSLYGEGGCRDQVNTCQSLSRVYDPENLGGNSSVNEICANADSFCADSLRFHPIGGRNVYDITQREPDPFPYPFYEGWLNQAVSKSAITFSASALYIVPGF